MHGKLVCLVLVIALLWPTAAPAYSVLTHEATIDAAWDASIKPLLRAKFPRITDAQLDEARAFAFDSFARAKERYAAELRADLARHFGADARLNAAHP